MIIEPLTITQEKDDESLSKNFLAHWHSVPDVEKAVEFYSSVMGRHLIMKPTVITEESKIPIGQMCLDVYRAGWGSFTITHMSIGDKTDVEIFKFKNNESPIEFVYWKTSTFHFCVQDPDIEGLVESKECLSVNTTQEKSHTKWFRLKIPLD